MIETKNLRVFKCETFNEKLKIKLCKLLNRKSKMKYIKKHCIKGKKLNRGKERKKESFLKRKKKTE